MGRPRRIDDIGQRYGRLTVMGWCDDEKDMFICQCDCGRVFKARAGNVRQGVTKSCGCLKREVNSRTGHESIVFAIQSARAVNERYDTNLQVISRTEPNRRNKSGKTGVWWDPKTGMYEAYISVHHKRHNLGKFTSFAGAAMARDKAEQIYHRPIIEARAAELLAEGGAS